jgi:anti-sigma factor RsiW
MSDDPCFELRLLIQADVDGELAPAEAARVGAHVETCPACAALQAQLVALAGRICREVPYHPASDALRDAVRARIAAASAAAQPEQSAQVVPLPRPARQFGGQRAAGKFRLPGWNFSALAPFGTGFALAACIALVLVLPRGNGLPDSVVADHIRALQPGHLMDVVSTDQHTVKPWFDGRLDYAPPVKDLKTQGFPLAGGRLDYLADRPIAALIYQRRQHLIDLYVWPDGGHLDHGPTEGARSGYNFVRWSHDGMTFWAVSDLDAKELADFVRLWQAA